MYKISKEFHFEYGHRVWSQTLDHGYVAAGDGKCACRHLHGHSGKVKIYAESLELENGMVTDFKHLGWIKDFIDQYLDHKFIVDLNDPMFKTVTGMYPIYSDKEELLSVATVEDNIILSAAPVTVVNDGKVYGWTPDLTTINGSHREYYESFFMVDFLPTSENMTRWLHELANEKMNKIGIKVPQVDWSETQKSNASYTS